MRCACGCNRTISAERAGRGWTTATVACSRRVASRKWRTKHRVERPSLCALCKHPIDASAGHRRAKYHERCPECGRSCRRENERMHSRIRVHRHRGEPSPLTVVACIVCECPVDRRGCGWRRRYHVQCPICGRNCRKEAKKALGIIRALNEERRGPSHRGANRGRTSTGSKR